MFSTNGCDNVLTLIRQTNPSNSADAIYKLSRLSRQLAKWRYELTYKQWAKTINDIQPDRQIVVKNEDMPLKAKIQKPE